MVAAPESSYTGRVFLRGGPLDGRHQHVEDVDLEIGVGFHDAPGGLYRPIGETEDSTGEDVPVLDYEHTDLR